MTARSSGEARRTPQCHTAGSPFDIADYVRASRRAQQLPESVDDPAVLERLISLLRLAEPEHQRQLRRNHG